MLDLPLELTPIIFAFQPLFLDRSWQRAQVLLLGALLAPGRRTVASILRILGRGTDSHFQNYHRVLNRAVWSTRGGSRILLSSLLKALAPSGPVVIGLDDTIERRWGAKIRARGIYRDPVRSSDSHFVKASGLRWLSVMLLVRVPWADRVWALPFLTALAPSERYYEDTPRSHKKLVDWARQMIRLVQRWLPDRELVLVSDAAFAAIELLAELSGGRHRQTCCITRLRLDARLYGPARRRKRGAMGRPRLVGDRLPSLQQVLTNSGTAWHKTLVRWYGQGDRFVEIYSDKAIWYHTGLPPLPIRWVLVRDPKKRFPPSALLCTDQKQQPGQILRWFLLRWQLEVTFQEVRAHLGMETQRQWSDLAIARTTPCLLALFSITTLLADRLTTQNQITTAPTAWYKKQLPTFADALAAVRQSLWRARLSCISSGDNNTTKIPTALLEELHHALCYAA